jgi:hypothetical protein
LGNEHRNDSTSCFQNNASHQCPRHSPPTCKRCVSILAKTIG